MRPAAVEDAKVRARAEWHGVRPAYPATRKVALVALIVVPALSVALVLAVLTGWWWLAPVLLGAWAVKIAVDAWSSDPLMLKRIGARALGSDEAPRLRNIVTGLAADLGVAPPEVYVISSGGPNALVRRGSAGGVMAVTRSLVESYTRTEQEAVVAHCLLRMHGRDFVYANLAARWSDLGAGLAPRVGVADDIEAAALTRYPPALVSALEKADPNIKRYTPLWFVAISPSHDDTAVRVAVLMDL